MSPQDSEFSSEKQCSDLVPVHSLHASPHPREVLLLSHTIKHTITMAFKPLPHLPFFFQGFLFWDNHPFCVPAPYLLVPPFVSSFPSLYLKVLLCSSWSPLVVWTSQLASDFSDPSWHTLLSLERPRSFSDHNSCLQPGPTNLGDSLTSDSLVSNSIFSFFNQRSTLWTTLHCWLGLRDLGLSFC